MEFKIEVAKDLLCMGCLCVEQTLREVTNEKLKQYYLECLNEVPLCNMLKTISICWECNALLKKAISFREQVKDSYRILQTYTSENLAECLLTDVSRPPRLKVCVIDSIDVTTSKDVQDEVEQPPRVYSANVKNEPKIEAQEKDAQVAGTNRGSMDSPMRGSDSSDEELEIRLQRHLSDDNLKNKKEVTNSSSNDNNKKSLDIDDLEMDKPKELQIVCVKEEVNVEYDKKDIEEDSDQRDCPTSDCSDTELESNLQKFLKTKKVGKKVKSNLKAVVKKGKKTVKRKHNKVKKSEEVDPEKKILTVKLSYEEMLLERQKESSKETFSKAVYKCETCLIGFNNSKAYKSHIANKHSPNLGKYSCPICNTVISSVDSFTEHCKRHFRRYECIICRKRTMDKKAIEQHYFSTHEISLKEYQCNLCGKISNSIDSHRYHRDSHKARVQCPECDKTFSHRAGLMNHRLAVHELQNTFPCTICDKVFRWRTSLKRHLEKHDLKAKGTAGGGEAFCATCGIEFSSLCSYRRHLRNSLKHVTRDQLKFICDHCNKRFADKTKLRDHIEEKHLHKVYHCHICNKATKNRVGLDQHIRYVHKSRPNNKMCHYCGKGFPTKVQLESHIRTHTGERPFICEYCPTTFSQKSNLYKHNRQVHLNIKTKRYPLCKKRKEERKSTEPIYQSTEEPSQKQPEEQKTTPHYPENLFNSVPRQRNEYVLGW
ncbi:unnamed protein product [Parnassius mnemosyne]|uniref:C2H2-type domain-containing protein n=1 Tax=Parnassius mnemosyne TaxID=213953 RepID=A0AAV1LAT3_9NEOP